MMANNCQRDALISKDQQTPLKPEVFTEREEKQTRSKTSAAPMPDRVQQEILLGVPIDRGYA